MPLAPGSHLGPYEVLALIGAGGMGEVYRARDPRLNREVAIKVLPADRLTDEGRRQRFLREARAAATLTHPHIVAVYEVQTAEGIDFLVMEYVRGKSLDALIPRAGLRLGETLRIGIAVADALAAAHARGIIHRDLKPGNVMVGTDGAVKVLDFGLAKLLHEDDEPSDPSASTHLVEHLTDPGQRMGTLAYMAPEQASGEAVDARADVFSFGAMLYEMATGQRAFSGKTPAETLSAVMQSQPTPPATLVPSLPHDFERTILRCLRKDPAKRFQAMADLRVDLAEIKEESDSGAGSSAPVARVRRTRLIVALATTLLLMSAATAWLRRSPPRVEAPPHVVSLTTLTGLAFRPTFSPDGEQVAFDWNGTRQDNTDIYVTLVGSSDVRRLTTDPSDDTNPAWSPDGRQIAFLRDRSDGPTIQLVSALGGADRKLSDFRGADSIAWSPDGQWLAVGQSGDHDVAGQPRGIYLIPADGGDARPLVVPTAGQALSQPAFSPDGRRLAYAACNRRPFGHCDIYVVELDARVNPNGIPQRLTTQSLLHVGGIAWTRDATGLVYSAGLTYFNEYLWRAGVDGTRPPERLEIAGSTATAPAMARSRDRLAFARVLSDADIYRVEAGRPAQLAVGSTFREEIEPRLSPDGRRLVFGSQRAGDVTDIWVSDADGANPRQLTHGPGRDQGSPYWSPDGRRIAFDSYGQDNKVHIWVIDADGGPPRRITTKADNEHVPTWSHDGRWVYFNSLAGTKRDIWRVAASGGTPERLTHGGSGPFACESADGKRLLFQLDDDDSPLMAMSLASGEVRQLVACVRWSTFGAGQEGVYYVPCDASSNPPVHVMDLDTGRDRFFGTLENPTERPLGLSVSPDGRAIVYPRQTFLNADLMLIENFR